MERRIDIHLRLSYDAVSLRPWLTAAMLLLAAGDLASENVTLTTYYPAPSGVYTQMITTANAFLARDGGYVDVGTTAALPAGTKLAVMGGKVGIGTTSPGATLDVTGNARVQQLSTTGGNAYNAGNPYAADVTLGSDLGARHDSSIMFWSAASASRIFGQADVFYLSTWNRDAVSGANVSLAAAPGGSSRVGGNLGVGATTPNASGRGYLFIDNTAAGCFETDTAGDVWNTACPAGFFITAQPGFYIQGWSFYNRGGQVLVQSGAGSTSTQVWGLNNGVGGTGNAQWMTLKKDDSIMHHFCCPK